ncbi:MAG: hypothetical protein GY799_33270 [Desulfobulbaceae bacterium]|nr:hypothetical protein [Desulfobulbaceae bacterium]
MSVYKCEGCEEPLLVGERCQPCDVRRLEKLETLVKELTDELNKQSMAIERAKTRPPSAYPFTIEW